MSEAYASEDRLLLCGTCVVCGISGMGRRNGVDVANREGNRACDERREVDAVEVGGIALRRIDVLRQLHLYKPWPARLTSVDQIAEMRCDRWHVYGRIAETSVERNKGKPHPAALAATAVCDIRGIHLRTPPQPIDDAVDRQNRAIVEILLSARRDTRNRIAGSSRHGIQLLKPFILFLLKRIVLLATLCRTDNRTVSMHIHRKAD